MEGNRTIDLVGTPYAIEDQTGSFVARISELGGQVELLRSQGTLREETLRAYFGDTKMQQIAESNAIEGSTLDIGETRLAVLSGVAISGHDPAYARDARNLAAALEAVVELAKSESCTDIKQLKTLHGLILGDRPSAGMFRNEEIRISGADHRPPRTWKEVMDAMEDWESWSHRNVSAPPLLRAIVLHTWLTHIHPFIDGNGRTARAVLNLELIRGGYPSVIIRKKDRVRYLNALADSDAGGDLQLIGDLVVERTGHAVQALVRVAKSEQGYDAITVQFTQAQENQVALWNDSVKLLFTLIDDRLLSVFGSVGTVKTKWYESGLILEDYQALLREDSSGNSHYFDLRVDVPSAGSTTNLAWTGFRSDLIRRGRNLGPGPSLFWSVEGDPGGHRWMRDEARSPGGVELTIDLQNFGRWIVRMRDGEVEQVETSELALRIVRDLGSYVTEGGH